MFKEEFGIGARVYNGKRLAEDSAALASIRNGGAAETGGFELQDSMAAGAAEKLFKDAFGITVRSKTAGKTGDRISVSENARKHEMEKNGG